MVRLKYGLQDLAECDTISTAFIFYNSDKSVYAAIEFDSSVTDETIVYMSTALRSLTE